MRMALASLKIRATDFRISNADNTADYLSANNGAEVSIRYNGAVKLATTATGIDVTGNATFADNGKAIFGAGSDLQIYHNGTDSFIGDLGTGILKIFGDNNILLMTSTGEKFIQTATNGEVKVYYDNAEKLATTSTGIDVTGTVTADGLTVDGDVSLSEASPTISFTDTTDSSQHLVQSINSTFNIQGQSVVRLSTAATKRFDIDNGGDISFYEDTGTTAKFFWDASAESLGIGTSSPSDVLHVSGGSSTDGILIQNPLSGSFYNAKLEFTRDGTSGGAKIQTERNSAGGVGLSFNYTSSNATHTQKPCASTAAVMSGGTTSPSETVRHSNTGLFIESTENSNLICASTAAVICWWGLRVLA